MMNGILESGALMRDMIVNYYGPPIPVNATGVPPV